MLDQDKVEFLMGENQLRLVAKTIMQVAARNKRLIPADRRTFDCAARRDCKRYTFHVDIR